MYSKFTFFCIFIQIFICSNAQVDTANTPIWSLMMLDPNGNYYQTLSAYRKYYHNRPKERHTGYKVFERWAEYWGPRVNTDGTFPDPMKFHNEYLKFVHNHIQPRSATGAWQSLGPKSNPSTPITGAGVGRINSIYQNPVNNHLYAGAPQGGFWISTDSGSNWITTTDNLPTLGVSAIVALTHTTPHRILIGTGDRDAYDAPGKGVWASTDNGITFVQSNSGMGNVIVNKLIVNPLNPNTIYAATSGGIYISYNQGINWVYKSSFHTRNYTDIQLCPNDTNTIYATHIPVSSSSFAKFLISTNSGQTAIESNVGLSDSLTRRMVIGVTPANPNLVYLLTVKKSDNTMEGFYRSNDKGVSFQVMNRSMNILGGDANGGTRGQGWYDIAIETSPTDPNFLLVGGINIFRSLNGGSTWNCVASWKGENGLPLVHADIHVFYRNPSTGRIYIGHDGGIDYTDNNGTSYTNINNGLTIGQIYRIGYNPIDSNKVIAGFQDNGTSVYNGSTWTNELGGDGMDCEINPNNLSQMLGCIQYGELNRTTNNGGTWSGTLQDILDVDRPWISPYQLHPRVNNHLTIAFRRIYTSNNIFSPIPNAIKAISDSNAEASSIRYSHASNNIVYVGFKNGDLRRSNNILSSTPSFTNLNKPLGSSNMITDIETSHRDSNIVYITQGIKVLRSSDMGNTWTDISSNLPMIPKLSIVLDKHTYDGIYVGTDAGVYYKDSTMSSWILYSSGLPAQSAINDLEIWYDSLNSNQNIIMAATYGRGLWKSNLRITETQPIVDFSIQSSVCDGLNIPITNNSNADSFRWTFIPSAGVLYQNGTNQFSKNPIVKFTNNGTYTIKLFGYKLGKGYKEITKSNIVTVTSTQKLTLSADTLKICNGSTQSITASGASTYLWSPANGLSSTSEATVSVSAPTNITKYRVISNPGGSSCTDTAYFTAVGIPQANFEISAENQLCSGQSTDLILTGDIDQYTISPKSYLLSDTSRINKITPTQSITYTIIGTKNGHCNLSKQLSIDLKAQPTYSYDPPLTQPFCIGQSYNINYIGNLPNIIVSPSSIANTISNNSFMLTPSLSDSTLIVSHSSPIYCTTYDTITLNVIAPPVLTISPANPSISLGDTLTLTAANASTYIWNSANGIIGSRTQNKIRVAPTRTTTYTVTGTSSQGCQSKSSVKVTVNSRSSIQSIENNDFCFYPNPSKGMITIETQKNITIDLIDTKGIRVQSLNLVPGQSDWNLSTLSNGVYYMRWIDNANNTKIEKIIIEK